MDRGQQLNEIARIRGHLHSKYSYFIVELLWDAFSGSRDAGWLIPSTDLLDNFVEWVEDREYEVHKELRRKPAEGGQVE